MKVRERWTYLCQELPATRRSRCEDHTLATDHVQRGQIQWERRSRAATRALWRLRGGNCNAACAIVGGRKIQRRLLVGHVGVRCGGKSYGDSHSAIDSVGLRSAKKVGLAR